MESFGSQLRAHRYRAGLSLAALAQRVHYSKSHLSKVENGQKEPGADLARSCDAELGADGALIAAATDRRSRELTVPDSDADDTWVMRLDADGRTAFQADRRTLLRAAPALAGWAVAPTPAPKSWDVTALHGFRETFDQLRRIGQAVPPAMLLPVVVAQTHALRLLAETAAGDARDRTFRLASRFAEYAGWMSQEAGSDEGALWWTTRAVALAQRGGDRDLAGYALVRHALVAMYQQDATATVSLAQRAQDSRLRPRIRGLAAQREAQGHALAGDRDSCRRALERAADLLSRADRDDAPSLGMSTVDPVALVTGWCLYDLGRYTEAAVALRRALDEVPPGAFRTHARFAARYALALVAAGEVDEACAVTEVVLDSMARTDSATIRLDLRMVAHQLRRWHRAPSVRDTLPRLTGALRTVAV